MDEDILTQMNDIQKRKQVLEEFNASTLDEVEPVGNVRILDIARIANTGTVAGKSIQ